MKITTISIRNPKFLGCTCGLFCFHKKLRSPTLVRAYFDQISENKVLIKSNSGNNGAPIKSVPHVEISLTEYKNRPTDPYNDLVETKWALNMMGYNFGQEDFENEENY